MTRRTCLALLLLACGTPLLAADPPARAGFHQVKLNGHTFTLPQGFAIELAATAPQVDRPVTAAFDDQGRLYVADSSGSNATPTDQIKNPTHRVVRLESSKKDGNFDKSVVFADKLSFLQGTMWRGGSLYVATPPTIQKLTDTDGDGKADKREVWFDGGVLTGCANDVHGPYPGPDGRIYWTKGAFAKQAVVLGTGKKFSTRAAHIYSAKADGSDIRVEMTGGMDNPVDVAFSSAGEMFFTTTFFQHPANGKRDGLVHNTYGAVYGKDHDPVSEHVWAWPTLNEPMTHLGPAAPSGLHCYRGGAFGPEYADNLFACQFNLAKVSRHVLKPLGSTYRTDDSDFVTSDNRDFHPTDVIEDADGSLLIVDTGGWYKLCCPSSVLEKKDVLGAIYRVRKEGAEQGRNLQPLDAAGNLPITPMQKARWFGSTTRADWKAKWVAEAFIELADAKTDRVLDTALTRALIDMGDVAATRKGLTHESDRVKRAALMALSQMPEGKLTAAEVAKHLNANGSDLSETAWWIVLRHPEWGEAVYDALVACLAAERTLTPDQWEATARRTAAFLHNTKVRGWLTDGVGSPILWRAVELAKFKAVPDEVLKMLEGALRQDHEPTRRAAMQALRLLPKGEKWPAGLSTALTALAHDTKQPSDLRFAASAVVPSAFSDDLFALALDQLPKDRPAVSRSAAAEALSKATLTPKQLLTVAAAIPTASPLDFDKLLGLFAKSKDEAVGLALVKALSEPKVRAAIRAEQVKPILDPYPKAVQVEAAKLYVLLESDRADMKQKLDAILSGTQAGDVRRGQAVFQSAKAACTACHKVHYVGGAIGPDLTKIGGIRGDRDLLEAIVYPSASFVRSYEPVKVETKDGGSISGVLKKDAPDEVTVTVSATEEVTVKRADIDAIQPGTVSVMPAGLDQQLTKQELADLVAFLKSLK